MLTTIILLSVFFLCNLANCRVYEGNIGINQFKRNKGWLFLDRMSFDEGTVSFNFSLELKNVIKPKNDLLEVDLVMIPHMKWMEEEMIKCDRSKSPTINNKQVKDDGKIKNPISFTISLQRSQSYTYHVSQTLYFNYPVTMHFVLRDCKKSILNEYFKKQTQLAVKMQMKNGQLHHSSDEKTFVFLLPGLLILTAAMVWLVWPSKQMFEENQRDWAKIILIIGLLLNFTALILNYIGFVIYIYGEGRIYGFFDFTYLLFHSFSEMLITGLLIFVAYGWTITFVADAQFDLYIPLLSMLGLINVILTLLGKINDGQSDKYHMYDTIPSYLLVFFRVVTVMIFLIGIIKTYRENLHNEGIKAFLIRLACLGGFFFLSLPVIMIMVVWLPHEVRKSLVFIFVELSKNGVNLALTWMVSSKRSKYSAVKAGGVSFMEAGNKLL